MTRRPCSDCPWRVDAPREHWDPQHFVDIWSSCQDDGTAVMLCHKATALPEPERSGLVCQGWVRVMGGEAIGVRLALLRGTVTVDELNDTAGPKLFPSFAAMLKANGIKIPERNVAVPIERVRRARSRR